ncbi:MAG: response regulator [Planctomycetota bacterium]
MSATAGAPETDSGQRRPTILVADDSRTVLRLTERTLEAAGYGVLLAEDGHQAIEVALAEHPDLIVLDINMPGLDGYGVCHDLLASGEWNKRTPFIFLTSADAPHLETLGNQLGAFLAKPTEPDALLDTVETLIQRFDEIR